MTEPSKPIDEATTSAAVTEAVHDTLANDDNASSDSDSGANDPQTADASSSAAAAANKKKKSKRKRLKAALKGKGKATVEDGGDDEPAEKKLSEEQLQLVLQHNPSLKAEMQGLDPVKAAEMLGKLNMSDLLAGMAVGGKNQKDMASYKFWGTQPVVKFEERKQAAAVEDGPIQPPDLAKVKQTPAPLPEGFEWVTMDLTDEKELAEVYDLLSNHYVEDDEAMFRFNYSRAFFTWALKAPGWKKEWHVGVRTMTAARKLVAFISGIPIDLRVRQKTLKCSEVNFLCIHKKLRSKRLAPVMIKEITRRCNLIEVWQAIYTAGVVLPTPVSTCRYFHRSLDWEKLYEVGFSPLPPNSTRQRQVAKYRLPTSVFTQNLRPMEFKDVKPVLKLLTRYLNRMDLAQVFTEEEIKHWLVYDKDSGLDQVIWSYVVEDDSGNITDFFSFYALESTVINSTKHKLVKAAYLFYYATETAFKNDQGELKKRLNQLVKDALVLAKAAKFDVFNALTLLDNPLFLDEQKFGAGDGQLHYYLYNYRTAPIAGGVNDKNQSDDRFMGGVGVVML